jgi:hypothetical protein
VIKTQMPMVYGAIQDKAQQIGKDAFALVRKGLRGEPNTFYAFERGYVVGTPFSHGRSPRTSWRVDGALGVRVCVHLQRAGCGGCRKGANDGKA